MKNLKMILEEKKNKKNEFVIPENTKVECYECE